MKPLAALFVLLLALAPATCDELAVVGDAEGQPVDPAALQVGLAPLGELLRPARGAVGRLGASVRGVVRHSAMKSRTVTRAPGRSAVSEPVR